MKAATKFYFNHYQLHSEIVLPLREVTARDRGRERKEEREEEKRREGERGGEERESEFLAPS